MLIPHLGGGGAEHVIHSLARSLNSEKYEIHLGLVTQSDPKLQDLPSSVVVHGLNASRVRAGAWKLLRLVWTVRPDVILSGMAHLNLLVLLLRPLFPQNTPIIVRQNGSLSAIFAPRPLLIRRLHRLAYRRTSLIICQTPSMSEELQKELGIPAAKLEVLPNPVDIQRIRASGQTTQNHWTGNGPNLLAIGRLVPEKGFDLLIEAFFRLRRDFPQAQLVIAGTGPLESTLKHQCASLGIEKQVQFVGHIACPAIYFPNASIFALSSRDEGLPNALLEAAAAGLPIVSLPASRGVADLLHEKEGVWLGDGISTNSLESALRAALSSTKPLQRLCHHWIEQFDMKPAIRCYENAIDHVLEVSRA